MHRIVMKAVARDDADLYVFDIILGPDGRPASHMPYFGAWGKVAKEDDRFPAVLTREGSIDLGAQTAEGSPRFHRTNLRDRKLTRGEYVSVWRTEPGEPEEEVTYCIAEVRELAPRSATVAMPPAPRRGAPVSIPPSVFRYFNDGAFRLQIDSVIYRADLPDALRWEELPEHQALRRAASEVKADFWELMNRLWHATWGQAVPTAFPAAVSCTIAEYGGQELPTVDEVWRSGKMTAWHRPQPNCKLRTTIEWVGGFPVLTAGLFDTAIEVADEARWPVGWDAARLDRMEFSQTASAFEASFAADVDGLADQALAACRFVAELLG